MSIAKLFSITGLGLDIIGVGFIASDLLSGRKGMLADLHKVYINTERQWDKIIVLYEKLRDRSGGYPEEHLQSLLTEVRRKKDDSLQTVKNNIGTIEQEARDNGFWFELKGILFIVAGFLLQVAGTILS